MKRVAVTCTAAAVSLGAWAGVAVGQRAAYLQLALDRPVNVSIADAPVGEVFRRLTELTGVRFVVGADVYDCLPYSEQTSLGVKIPGVVLRKALSEFLAQQAMEWTIEGDAVRIVPGPALLRMNRRATYEELTILGKMHSEKMQPTKTAGSVLEQLRKVTGNKELDLAFHRVEGDEEAARKRAERVLPDTAAVWLDMLCHGQGWTWYLWGDHIMIVDKKAQVARQLQRQVSLRYENAQLVTILLDLAKKARLQLNMDPGVMSYLPVETRQNFNLMMSEATIDQALKVISGATGLVFLVEPDGIRVEASERLKLRAQAATAPSAQKTPFYLKKTLVLPDGSTVELLLRPEDLPEDVQEAIQAERAKLFELLTRKYRPSTRPASAPPAK